VLLSFNTVGAFAFRIEFGQPHALTGAIMAAKKNSLVENINRRKRAGTSRPKSKSTVSTDSYQKMQSGWEEKKAPVKKAAKKTAKKAPSKKASQKTGPRR
jgi:hypothetical protein